MANIRVLVDWDNNSLFNLSENPSVAKNMLSPTPSLTGVSAYDIGGGTTATSTLSSDFGPTARIVTVAALDDGLGLFATSSSSVLTQAVTALTQYTFSVWVKVQSYTVDRDFKLSVWGATTAAPTTQVQQGTTTTETVNGDWTQISTTFTTGSTVETVGIRLQVADSVGAADFAVAGIMLTTGLATDEYNDGSPLVGYENVTRYVYEASWTTGSKDGRKIVDGQADIVLNNSDYLFFPENTSSPLNTYLKPNLRVLIQIQNGAVWQTVWSGFINTFDPSTNLKDSYQVTIQATQGIERIQSITVTVPDSTADNALTSILEQSGWRSPGESQAGVFTLGTSLLNTTTYLSTPDVYFNTLDAGVAGTLRTGSWTSKEAVSAINDVLEAEAGWLLVNNQGELDFYNRTHFSTLPAADVSLDLDASTVLNGAYEYGKKLRNKVTTSYSRELSVGVTVIMYTTGGDSAPFFVAAGQTGQLTADLTTVADYLIKAQNLHSSFIDTVPPEDYVYDLSQTSFEDITTPEPLIPMDAAGLFFQSGTLVNVITASTTIGGTYTAPSLITVTYTVVDNIITFNVTNGTGTDYYMKAERLYPEMSLTSTGAGDVEVVDQDSLLEYYGANSYSYSGSLFFGSQQATDFSQYILDTRSTPYGEFTNLELSDRDGWLSTILNMGVGNIVAISHTPSGLTSRKHLVVGGTYRFYQTTLDATINTVSIAPYEGVS